MKNQLFIIHSATNVMLRQPPVRLQHGLPRVPGDGRGGGEPQQQGGNSHQAGHGQLGRLQPQVEHPRQPDRVRPGLPRTPGQ